jgi:hypothetical protein
MSRKHITLSTKLAAALLELGDIPFSQAQRMTTKQIIKLYHFDHYPIPHAEGGPDEPWNLKPMLMAAHREKTAKIDVPGIAKRKRITKAQIEFRILMLTPRDQRPPKKRGIPSRPFPSRRKVRP